MDLTWFDELEAQHPQGRCPHPLRPLPHRLHARGQSPHRPVHLAHRPAQPAAKFILRIEDTDQGRLVEGATEVIYATLRKCGLTWDEGPDVGGPVGPYIQTQRRELYGKYAELLVEKGHAYYCFCEKDASLRRHSRRFRPGGTTPAATCPSRRSGASWPPACPMSSVRKSPREGTTTFSDAVFGDITVENATLDDQVLIKSGRTCPPIILPTSLTIISWALPTWSGELSTSPPRPSITCSTRPSAGKFPPTSTAPPSCGTPSNKMSKRHGDPSYEDPESPGLSSPRPSSTMWLCWAGLPGGELAEQEFFTLEELAQAFDITGISKSPAIFDLEKLNYFNSAYLKALSPEAFLAVAEPYLKQGITNPSIDLRLVAPLVQTRLNTLTEIPPMVDFFDRLPEYSNTLYLHKKMKTNEENSLEALQLVVPVFQAMTEWSFQAIHDALLHLAEAQGLKNGRIMWPVRVAVSGKATTPGGAVELCHILGKEETLRRVQQGIRQLTPQA